MATLLCFTACGDDKPSSTNEEREEAKEKAAEAARKATEQKILPICPQVAIVRELDDIHDYGSEPPAPEQLVSEARMQTVQGACSYQDTGIDITFDLNFIAGRGPRMGSDHASYPYFIAVVDPEQAILNKDKMTVEFKIPNDKDNKIAERTESLHVFIPLAKEKRAEGPQYQVLLGFQLTQEQLDAVRAKRTKQPGT